MEQQVAFTPWRSIRAGVVPVTADAAPLSFDEALASPCSTCSTSPCCTHLPLHNFRVGNLGDLSYAAYLLNFDRIRLGVTRGGDWSVYFVEPCRFLDRQGFGCTLHDSPDQPEICRNYNPYHCWYKRSLRSSTTADFLLVDRARLQFLTDHVTFDDEREIVGMPDWDELVAAVEDIADEAPWDDEASPADDAAFESWQALTLGRSPVVGATGGAAELHAYDDASQPCATCAAPCCETLTFGQGLPATRSALDFYRFCLGFPGVELSIGEANWSIVVKTTCRHLEGGRCGIFGQPERPLFCRYYDAWKCTYRTEFGEPRPEATVRVRLDDLRAVTDGVTVDGRGAVVAIDGVEAIRDRIEASWRTAAAAGAP